MEHYAVHLSGAAKDDIRNLYAYVDGVLCDHERAVRLYGAVKRAVLSLQTMPKRRSLVADDEFAAMGIRSLEVERHLVFYIVQDIPQTVVVLRVLHGRREWRELLEPEASD